MINMCSQQTGLAGLFPCRALLCFWDGEAVRRQPAGVKVHTHSIPSPPGPCQAFSLSDSPTKPGPDIPLSRGWCSLSLRHEGSGGEANPATWPEVLHCLPVCPRRGDREESGHHHVPFHTCPLLLTSVPRPGDKAKPTLLLQKSWSVSCLPCCLPPSTSFDLGPGPWPLRLSSRQQPCVPRSYLMVCKCL